MATVYLGLGSNLGERYENIKAAIAQLKENHITIKKCSTVIETNPVDGPPQNRFLNAVIKTQTSFSPIELLTIIKSIEQKFGRKKTVLNGPRAIDIDILLYDDVVVNTPALTIPHPRMLERNFVLKPLKEIAPEMIKELSHARHPVH